MNANGNYYLGRFHIPTKTISISPRLSRQIDIRQDPRFSFTLAHEIGHFMLHRRIESPDKIIGANNQFEDTKESLKLNRVSTDDTLNWLEWQANKFAAALLIPRIPFQRAIHDFQKKAGLARCTGILFVDDQGVNLRDFFEIRKRLAELYQTSATVVERRIRELNYLDDHRKKMSRSGGFIKAGDVFKDIQF